MVETEYYGGRIIDDAGNEFVDSANEFGLCKVIFDSNGGKNSNEEEKRDIMYVYPGTSIKLPGLYDTGYNRKGTDPVTMTLVGWSKTKKDPMYFKISANNTISWYNVAEYGCQEENIVISTDLTLYAVWFDPSRCVDEISGSAKSIWDRQIGSSTVFNTKYTTQHFGGGTASARDHFYFTNVYGNETEVLFVRDSLHDEYGTDEMIAYTYDHRGAEVSAVSCNHTVFNDGEKILLTDITFGKVSMDRGFRICIYLNTGRVDELSFGAFFWTYHAYLTPGTILGIIPQSDLTNVVQLMANGETKTFSMPYHTAFLLPSPSVYPKAGSTMVAWAIPYNDAPMYRATGTFVNAGFARDNGQGSIDNWEAQYEANKFIITYDLNGGIIKGTSGGANLSYATTSGSILNVNDVSLYERKGYTLVGWDRVDSAGNNMDSGGIMVPSSYPYYLYPNHPKTDGDYTFITLKARWVEGAPERKTFRVTESIDALDVTYDMSAYPGYKYFIPRSDSPSFIAEGFEFTTWKDSNGNSISNAAEASGLAQSITMPSSDYTVTAQYQSVEYTFVIKYVNLTNGKNPSKDSNTVTAKVRDTSKAFSLTKPSVDSLIFIGWGIGENAEAVQIDAGESTFTLSLNTQGAIRNGNTITITLRAIWADSTPTFRLLFKYPQCNDLTSTPISVLESGALESGTSYTFVIPVTVPKRQSLWRFLGWMRTTGTFTGSDLLNPGDEVIVTRSGTSSDIKGELTLYAHWFRFKYDLSYDLRGGALDAIKGYTEYSTLSGVRSVMVPRETPYDPTRTFVGWKDEDGVPVNAGSTIALSPAKMTENLSSGAEEFYISVSTELIDKNNWIISQNGNPEKKVLTAQYEGEKAVLSFNLRGGSAPSDDETLYKDMIAERTGTASNHTFAIPSTIPVKKAYAFVTWSTSPTEKIASSTVSIYAPGANVVVPYGQYLELYAHWAYAPAASWGPEISYNLEKAIPIIVDTCAVDNGVVSSVGVEKVISLEPPEVVPNSVGATRDKFTVASSPTYSITLFLRDRQSGQSMTVTPVNGTGWYFARKVYPMKEGQSPTLELHILRSSVANTMDEENKIYLTDYVMRVVTEDSDGNQYNAYHSFIIAPAGKSDDPILTGPECTLSTYMTEGAEESRIFIEGITGFSKNYDVSLMEFPILTRKVEDRYIIDMGTVESYSLSFTRANPQITDNASSDSRKWTNAQWITQFRGFLNFWQNLSYARVDGEYRRTGGFRLTYIPPDISLFPIIEKNVFVKGNVDFDYTVGRVKGNLTLIAANMQMEKVKKPAVIEIYFCRTKRDAEYKVVAFTYVAYQGIPWTIPSFPSDFSPDCVYWTDSNGNRYYPGNDVETDILSNRYLYAVELEVIGTEVRDVSGLHTLSIPDDARVVKAIIVGGGGAGDHGNANIAVMLGNWMSAFVLDFTSGAGGGSGEARYVSFTVSPTMNKVLNIYVGAGGDKDSSDKRDGESSYVEYSSLRLSASGGKAASVGKGGTLYYKGGDGYFKGGWLSIDNFDGMNDIATSHGQTNKVSPKGIPGKSNQFGSGGGAAALEAGVGMSTVTSVGGYWDGKSRKDPRYGGGGAGGGFYCTAPDVRANESGSGASGYVLVAYYNDVVKE